MPSTRSAIILTITILGISVAYSTWSLMRPPDSGGRGRDSYGTRWHGGRAWFELLAESGIHVERRLGPPSSDMPAGVSVLWMPDDSLAGIEPAYLEQLRHWIESGNRVVVAPATKSRMWLDVRTRTATFEDVLELLGVEGVSVSQEKSPDTDGRAPESGRQRLGREVREAWEEMAGQRDFPSADVATQVTGKALSADRIQSLHVPLDGLHSLKLDTKATAAALGSIRLDQADEPIVVVVMPVGKGEVAVVAEPFVLANAALNKGDNAVLAYDLAATHSESTVTFDEFYHGLAVRGNPLWLLTQPVYSSIIVACAIVAGLVLWRRATAFGPPLDPALRSRRTVVEYVQATAKFLGRSRGAPSYVLEEVRTGTLHELASSRHGETPLSSPEAVLAALRRRSPQEAERLRQSLAELDAALALGPSLSRHQAVQALQGILQCLSHNSTA